MKKNAAKALPNKLSDLLETALNDLEKVEKDKRFKIAMFTFCSPPGKDGNDTNRCDVCLAGSALIHTCGFDVKKTDDPNWFRNLPFALQLKLEAIDDLRLGQVETAAYSLGLTTKLADRDITAYDDNRRLFKKDLRALVADLRKMGE